MEYYSIWFFLFVIAAYFIITDDSVARSFYFITKLLKFEYGKTKWWLLNNPRNPIVKYLMWRKSDETCKRIRKRIY